MVMRAFLVDDESLALKRLQRMLAVTGRVVIAGTSTDPVEAVEAILKAKPDVLFLDIEMPGMTGFQMLSKLDPQPLIVFTTAYDQYALDAFGVNSVDYLLKPIDPKELVIAVRKIRIQNRPPSEEQFRMLMNHIHHKEGSFSKIAIPTVEGFELVHIDNVVYCRSKAVGGTGGD